MSTTQPLTPRGRALALAAAFLGWMMAGTVMVIVPLVGRAATASFLADQAEGTIGDWFARYICAFLLGAAAGGWMFGWLGDRVGRVRAMAASILCYSIWTGIAYFASSPGQFLVLRFLACLGVGGMWPNGVALVSEVWPNVSRPMLAGLIGTAANLGFMGLSLIAKMPGMEITPDQWRWVMVLGSTPAVLALLTWLCVPESPKWLAEHQSRGAKSDTVRSPGTEVFRPPLLRYTILGICLGTVPLMGNWGSANWTVPWAGQVGGLEAPALKASTQLSKSTGGAIGALLGGWLASRFGRRKTYFLISLISLFISFTIFRYLKPGDPTFLTWVFGIGFFGTLYFGWLPLYLPELFPTRVRATGSGVSFNFGRILTALGVLGTGQLMLAFEGDYARVGQVTCLIYVMGTIVILFAPDTSQKQLDDG